MVCRGLTCWCLMFDMQTEPCLSGGECSVTFNDFTCSCPEEFTGKTCETRVWCVSNPCVNGGRCVDLPDGYECKNSKDSHSLCKLPKARNAESLSEARSIYSSLKWENVIFEEVRAEVLLVLGLSPVFCRPEQRHLWERPSALQLRRLCYSSCHRHICGDANPFWERRDPEGLLGLPPAPDGPVGYISPCGNPVWE